MRSPLRRRGAGALGVLVAAALLTGPSAAADPTPDSSQPLWREVLADAAEASRTNAYRGEALWITWTDGAPHVTTFDVLGTARGDLTVRAADRYTVRIGDDGGGLIDHEQGWFLQLPAVGGAEGGRELDRLEDKYRVEVAGTEALHDRACTRLDVRRRLDGSLRERLWIDQASGLLLRRETYDGDDTLLALATYLALDLIPDPGPRDPGGVGGVAYAHADRGRRDRLEQRPQGVTRVGPRALQALRDAGWLVPEALPGGYEPSGVWAVSSLDSQALQTVYGDGLYRVSLFQQRGRPDWESLPPGAEQAQGLDWRAYTWPGAIPQRLVWEADGTTFSLVGDAPADDLQTIATALPHPRSPGLAERLRRGLGRLWSWAGI